MNTTQTQVATIHARPVIRRALASVRCSLETRPHHTPHTSSSAIVAKSYMQNLNQAQPTVTVEYLVLRRRRDFGLVRRCAGLWL